MESAKTLVSVKSAASPRVKTASPRKMEAEEKCATEVQPTPKAQLTLDLEVNSNTSLTQRGYGGGGDQRVRLPIECLSKSELKETLRQGRLNPFGYSQHNEYDTEEDEEEVHEVDEEGTVVGPDRARFNVWKGTNYDLHVLGNFKSDFEKKVKSFQRPPMEQLDLDPFCRTETSLEEEPKTGSAFLIWKSTSSQWDSRMKLHKPGRYSPLGLGVSSSSDDDDDDDSLTDPEIKEYIESQRKKKEEGLNITGETIFYDEEFQILRNLHRESHSLTNYGLMPDEKWMGKAHVFYPEMTEEEKKILTWREPPTQSKSQKKRGCSTPRKGPRTPRTPRTPRSGRQTPRAVNAEGATSMPSTPTPAAFGVVPFK